MKCSRSREEGGYLTVFLSLTLVLVISLVTALLQGARKDLIREQALLVTDTAADSVLAQYSRELFERYDLFFVDCSYQTGDPSEERVLEHFTGVADRNLQARKLLGVQSVQTFTSLSLSGVSLSGTRFAADDGGEPVRRQIAAYMSADPAGAAADQVLSVLDDWNGLPFDFSGGTDFWEQERGKNLEEIGSVEESLASEEADQTDGTGQEPAVQEEKPEDPAETVDGFRRGPVLSQVLEPGETVSNASVDADSLPSHRSLHQGTGLVPENEHPEEDLDAVTFDRYLLEKCGTWREKKEGSRLSYEVEYILFGKESDRENLSAMAGRLLLVRSALNLSFLLSDAKRKEEARTFARTLSSVLLHPALEPVFTTAVLIAWSYVESVKDVKTLLSGRKVPLIKTDADWSTDVSDITSPGGVSAGQGSEHGLTYRDYLQIFLFMENETEKTRRFLDICEMDLRLTPGNEAFRIDWCLDAFCVQADYGSGFGFSCSTEKTASYN